MLCKNFQPVVPMCQLCRKILLARNYASSGLSNDLPRITVPHKMMQKINKQKTKQVIKKANEKRPQLKGMLMVSCKRKEFNHYQGQRYSDFSPQNLACKRKEFNHYQGQRYSDFSPQNLASKGWKHYQAKGDYFTINAIAGNPSTKATIETEHVQRFDQFGLHAGLLDGLQSMGIAKPTNIQTLTIPQMLNGTNIQCAAETGSGKTLAYLLPIMQGIYQSYMDSDTIAPPTRPLGIILVPSRELGHQIHGVASELGKFSQCKTCNISGGRNMRSILGELAEGNTDLLIATPGLLDKMIYRRQCDFSGLRYIVLDEADTLLDDSFNDVTRHILQELGVSMDMMDDEGGELLSGRQVALVGATMPRDLDKILEGVLSLDSLSKITTNHLHRLMPHVPQKFMRTSSGEKPERALKLLSTNSRNKVPTLVFCGKSSTSFFLGHTLEENRVPNVVLNAELAPKERDARFEKFQSGECDVMICTDIASRGLDTVRADQVINYDFPDFMSDYIHRLGRVGRVGSKNKGYAVSFICHKWEVDLLWKIEAAARRLTELHNVNANIKRKLTSIVQQKFGHAADVDEEMLQVLDV